MILWLVGLVAAVALFGTAMRVVAAVVRGALAVAVVVVLGLVAVGLLRAAVVEPPLGAGLLALGGIGWWLATRRRTRTAPTRPDARPPPVAGPPRSALTPLPPASPADEAALLDALAAAARAADTGDRHERARVADERLALAWTALDRIGGAHRVRLAVARASCERLLVRAGTGLVAPSVTDALVGIRKGLPELAEACLRHRLSAPDAATPARAAAQAIATVERIAARAERAADLLARDDAAAFDLTLRHLDARSAEDRPPA